MPRQLPFTGQNTSAEPVFPVNPATGFAVPAQGLPTAESTAAIVPVVTATAQGGLILKASPGNLYSLNFVTGAQAGYIMLFDATTIPADGTVSPRKCLPVAANGGMDYDATSGSIPLRFNTGIVAVFSSTGPFTKTQSNTAFISGNVA